MPVEKQKYTGTVLRRPDFLCVYVNVDRPRQLARLRSETVSELNLRDDQRISFMFDANYQVAEIEPLPA
jgi:hypothetical protein